ncbi:uncharacterized protein [Montipora capricornis]|uniref:uncharacterized protein n=1 Tax=Montipora capricornis TaxID=246305 RepID=UPI0035F1BB49
MMEANLKRKSPEEDDQEQQPHKASCSTTRWIAWEPENYPEWVRSLDDDEILKLFNLGVKVRPYVTVGVADMGLSKEFLAATEPLQHQLEGLEEKMDFQAPANPLKQQLEGLKKKMEEDVTKPLKKLQARLEFSSHSKGRVAEHQVYAILKKHFPNFTIVDTSRERGKGDQRVETSRQHKILIEIKNYESGNVPQSEVDKFIRDMQLDSQLHVGILFSMAGGIANKIKTGSSFEVVWTGKQHLIYVSNAAEDETLLVWSVWLADELAETQKSVEGRLEATQLDKLKELYEELKQNKKHQKTLQDIIKSLEENVSSLKENALVTSKSMKDIPNKMKTILNL